MLVRILYTLRSRIWDMVLFLFSVFWLHVNEFNSLWEEDGGEIRRLLLARKIYHPEEKNDILPQYSSEFIVYNGSWRYHLIIIDSIVETVSE